MAAEVTTLQKLANATKTFHGCGGHKKAERNEELCKRYRKQLEEAGEAIPETAELLKMGEFNGEGSH